MDLSSGGGTRFFCGPDPHPTPMKFTLPFLLAALAITSKVGAVVVIDNFTPGGNSFATSVTGPVGGGFFAPPPNRQSTFSFVTGSDVSYLDTLEVVVNVGNNNSGMLATISTGSSLPGGSGGTVISTVTAASSPITQVLTFSPTSTILLNAATQYWILFSVPSGSGVFSMNNTTNVTTAPGWTLENTYFYAPTTWTELSSGPQARIRLSVTPIPEVSSPMMGCIGVFLLLRRRNRNCC